MLENKSAQLSEQLTDLSQCEKEPLNFIGSIQAHGCLLSFTLPDRRIQSCSENADSILGIPSSQIIANKIDHVFSVEFAEDIAKTVTRLSNVNSKGLYLSFENQKKKFQVYLFETEGLYVLEINPSKESEISRLEMDQKIRDYLVRLKDSDKLEVLSAQACQAIREVSGFDRVMMYRFLPPHWHGEVLAESRAMHAHSYNQHRFPASDIPRIARDLYLRNGVRSIPDVTAPIYKISPVNNPKTRRMIDLSDSRLRAVSPIHLEYLKNMGVGASYSFAVIVKEELWGLVACHHLSPLNLNADQLIACELIANAFAGVAPILQQSLHLQERLSFGAKLNQLIEVTSVSQDPISELFKSHMSVFDSFRATGMAYVSGTALDMAGICPTSKQLQGLAERLRQKMHTENKNALALQTLSPDITGSEDLSQVASGLLCVQIAGVEKGLFILFRPEHIETIVWGGDPRKQLDKKNFQGRIHPRASFETWTEQIRAHSLEWSKHEIEGLLQIRSLIFEVLSSKQKLITELTLGRIKK